MKFHLERYPDNIHPAPILIPRAEIEWECGGIFNPSVYHDGEIFHLLYRANSQLIVRKPKHVKPGNRYINRRSYIGYATSKDGVSFKRRGTPFISPNEEYDAFGCEDPRITKINDTFYITYTAIDGELDLDVKPNVRIALATTKDFITVEKKGIIGPASQSKAAAFFGEKIDGDKIGLLMTHTADSVNSKIILRTYDNLENIFTSSDADWQNFLDSAEPVLPSKWWLHRGPELGAPPIKTDRGWLLIFSSESMSSSWTISAALLDLENPHKLIARTPGCLLEPVTIYEREGIVPSVTFPEGAVIVGEDLYVYYGCADTVIGLATCKLNNLLDYLETFKNN